MSRGGVDSRFAERAADQFILVRELFDETEKLKQEGGIVSLMAVFSIYAQWIEWNLGSLLVMLAMATTEGEVGSFRVHNNSHVRSAAKDLTLGQQVRMLGSYELFGNDNQNLLNNYCELLKKFLPLRNELTHEIFNTDFRGTDSHLKVLIQRLNAAISLEEDISKEQQELYRVMLPSFPIVKRGA
ncbi:MAG TPA: hypothetical protein VF466_02690 [Candidatus Saccharimonadales bacterium]